jgi:hypothetical protein
MRPTLFQRGAGVFGGLVFLGMGLFLLGLLGSSFVEALHLRLQPGIPFQVAGTEIVTADLGRSGFDLVIRFREPGRSELGRAELHAADYRDLVVAQRSLAPGATVIGRRLPADHPARLDLVEPGFNTLLALPLLALPLAFASAGGWMIWGSWTGRIRPEAQKKETSPYVTLGAGVLFMAMGTLIVALLVVIPVVHQLRSRDWVATRAVVEMSRSVVSRGSKGGRSWHPEVLYRYEYGGLSRRSSQIRFSGGGSRSGTGSFLARHPSGAKVTCWVNPRDPDEAVLERGSSWIQAIGLLFLLFPVAGAYLLRAGWRALRQSRRHPLGRGRLGPFGLRRL